MLFWLLFWLGLLASVLANCTVYLVRCKIPVVLVVERSILDEWVGLEESAVNGVGIVFVCVFE